MASFTSLVSILVLMTTSAIVAAGHPRQAKTTANDRLRTSRLVGGTRAASPASPPHPQVEPAPAGSYARVIVRGRVSCRQCTKNKVKSRGLSGVFVLLSCPQANLTMETEHHGQFSMVFHHMDLTGFPGSCAVSVVTQSLPSTCNNPLNSTAASSVPSLSSISSTAATYEVPPFEFLDEDCGTN